MHRLRNQFIQHKLYLVRDKRWLFGDMRISEVTLDIRKTALGSHNVFLQESGEILRDRLINFAKG